MGIGRRCRWLDTGSSDLSGMSCYDLTASRLSESELLRGQACATDSAKAEAKFRMFPVLLEYAVQSVCLWILGFPLCADHSIDISRFRCAICVLSDNVCGVHGWARDRRSREYIMYSTIDVGKTVLESHTEKRKSEITEVTNILLLLQ